MVIILPWLVFLFVVGTEFSKISFAFLFQVREGEQGDVETRRIVRYPDSHQLFVGNLPHDVDKSELKDFFQSKLVALLSSEGLGVAAMGVVNRAF